MMTIRGGARQPRAGAQSVLLRLSEVLFIEVIRRHLDALSADRAGWLAGLRDPVFGRALALLHARPTDSWTLERLADEAGVSRSTLVECFTHIVGQPPMRYLTRWDIVGVSPATWRRVRSRAVANQLGEL